MTGPVSVAIPLDAAGDGAPVIAVRDLVKTFGTGDTAVDAVRHVSFDLAAGEILLVMGPSGSGKTTLLLMLGALLRPTAGSITVTGRAGAAAGIDIDIDIATAPERMLPRLRARAFGFVFQDYALLGALSAAENITVAANLAGVSGPPAAARASALLDRVGLTNRAAARPGQLSGGEQQRVAVARALVNDPPLLLADEPTANLDAAHGRDIARLLRDLADHDRRGVVIVSHDDRLRQVADRVLWLEDGAFQELASRAVDPVCGMPVERTGSHQATVADVTYWFCAAGCRAEFLLHSDHQ
jgi:putative ABC transport system ATP-binding protein